MKSTFFLSIFNLFIAIFGGFGLYGIFNAKMILPLRRFSFLKNYKEYRNINAKMWGGLIFSLMGIWFIITILVQVKQYLAGTIFILLSFLIGNLIGYKLQSILISKRK